LLAALKDILGIAEAHVDRARNMHGTKAAVASMDADLEKARAAIAKAEGR
jgi:hypothetical protein